MEKSIKNDFRGLENLMKIVVQECDWHFAVRSAAEAAGALASFPAFGADALSAFGVGAAD